jgi:hypothetical protein
MVVWVPYSPQAALIQGHALPGRTSERARPYCLARLVLVLPINGEVNSGITEKERSAGYRPRPGDRHSPPTATARRDR